MFELFAVSECCYTPSASLAHGEEGMSAANCLYFGDCLEVMREDIPSESIDLIYLDPPFNSKRLYNAFIGGAQWVAFDDTWQWYEAVNDFHEVAQQPQYKGIMEGLRLMLGNGPQLAYLSYMANRLVECYRVLKPNGSIYLHCDPTMEHYLKAVMDGIFGGKCFRTDISWRRTNAHNDAKQGSKQYGNVRDTLLFYTKGSKWTWNWLYTGYSQEYVESFYKYIDQHSGRRYRMDNLTAAKPGGDTSYLWRVKRTWGGEWQADLDAEHVEPKAGSEYKGVPPYNGRYWAYSSDNMATMEEEGRIVHNKNGMPNYKRYLDEMLGVPLQNDWTDIHPASKSESFGYPTQKPVALLERIIAASSNEGDVVLDPFCGCGTTIHAAQNLNRHWVGIDICVNACKVIEERLQSHFDSLWSEVEFHGLPKTRDDAQFMASSDPFRFERWAASLVDGMEANKKQQGDKGIDGWGRLPIKKGQFIDLVSQVKGGHTNPGHVQAFNGARQQAGADLGIFTCFGDKVTTGMRNAAVGAGLFMETPVIQIYTVEAYFEGRKPKLPVAA